MGIDGIGDGGSIGAVMEVSMEYYRFQMIFP
jgi:hypothetical protein